MNSQNGITLYSDGLCEPRNPQGYSCWGWVAIDSNGQKLAENCGCIGFGLGNNVSEYRAAIETLEWAKSQRIRDVLLRADSQLVVYQVQGKWKVNAQHLKPLVDQVRKLLREVSGTIEWVPREQNEEADAMSRKAYDEVRKAA